MLCFLEQNSQLSLIDVADFSLLRCIKHIVGSKRHPTNCIYCKNSSVNNRFCISFFGDATYIAQDRFVYENVFRFESVIKLLHKRQEIIWSISERNFISTLCQNHYDSFFVSSFDTQLCNTADAFTSSERNMQQSLFSANFHFRPASKFIYSRLRCSHNIPLNM